MKINNYIFTLLTLTLLNSCKQEQEPEFYKNGKAYYTNDRCLEEKVTYEYEYHYGYNFRCNCFEWYYGLNSEPQCIKSVIDTIEIKHFEHLNKLTK